MAARDLYTFSCKSCGAKQSRATTPEELEAIRARNREKVNRSYRRQHNGTVKAYQPRENKPAKLTPKQIAPDVSGKQAAPVIQPGRGIACGEDVIEIVYREYRPWLILNGGNPLPASPIEAALYKKLVEVTK
jgi:hypothetical protein